ncbi:MAG: hypothetical protein WA964_16670 [Ilumatobacter sp.]|uniref:hypothetical protein n=1 Tax=Ilumatobacter sp. TaxID=1967498 RepID=UPI003C70B725
MSDPKPAGEDVEDMVEDVISTTSPLEDEDTDGGSDEAGRRGDAALGDDEAFNA